MGREVGIVSEMQLVALLMQYLPSRIGIFLIYILDDVVTFCPHLQQPPIMLEVHNEHTTPSCLYIQHQFPVRSF